MNLVRGSTGEFCVLKKAKIQPRITTGNDPECEDKNETKQRLRTSSLMTLGVEFMLTTSEHRAATISAPKSVSLAALIGGDDRIRDAYRESLNEALKELEKYLQARGGGPPSRHHKP
jgi:hypothetical protein